jgi:hypothetical protein
MMFVFALVLSGLAFAQEPIDLSSIPGLPPGLQMQLGGPKAEVRWLSAESGSTRFPGDPAPGPTFAAGEVVEVLVAEGDRTRVRKGDRYGWVPTSVLSMTAPEPVGGNPLLGGMQPLLPAGTVPAPAPAGGAGGAP